MKERTKMVRFTHATRSVAAGLPLHTAVEEFPLEAANEALERLRSGAVSGAVALSL